MSWGTIESLLEGDDSIFVPSLLWTDHVEPVSEILLDRCLSIMMMVLEGMETFLESQ